MKRARHWQDYGNIVLGAWLLIAPLVLGFTGQLAAMANTFVVGALLVGVALGAILLPKAWEDWTEAALGAWLALSPWLFDFETQIGTVNAVVTGLLVITLALWAVEDEELIHGGGAPTPL